MLQDLICKLGFNAIIAGRKPTTSGQHWQIQQMCFNLIIFVPQRTHKLWIDLADIDFKSFEFDFLLWDN